MEPGLRDWNAGLIQSDTDDALVLNSPEDGIVTLSKSDIQARDKGLSGMPEGLDMLISKRDIRDVVEFLNGLK